MSTKPTQVPTWATDDNYSGTGVTGIDGTPTKTEPTSGRKAQGWVPSLKVGAQGDNWNLNLIGQWAQYLNDGDIELNSLKVDTTTELDGAVTLDSTLNAFGPSTFTQPIYEMSSRQGVLSWSRADGLANASVTGRNLVTTGGAWQWIGPVFGDSGDLVTNIAIVIDPSSVADTIAWELHRLSVAVDGSITDAIPTGASGSVSAPSGKGYFSFTLPAESSSYEPLDALSSYYIKLSGAATGVVLGAGGARYNRTRPPAV